MKAWVIDTNVVVSGLLSPHGPPARVLDAVLDGRIQLAFDPRILGEYRDVLQRPRLRLAPELVRAFLAGLQSQLLVTPLERIAEGPDADDLIFIEVALATKDRTIVTGNAAHFPARILRGVRVISPTQALAELTSAKE